MLAIKIPSKNYTLKFRKVYRLVNKKESRFILLQHIFVRKPFVLFHILVPSEVDFVVIIHAHIFITCIKKSHIWLLANQKL